MTGTRTEIPVATVTPRQLIQSLASTLCPACGERKRTRKTFCGGCYFQLTNTARRNLYQPVGGGYEQAVANAMAQLEAGVAFLLVDPTGKSVVERSMAMLQESIANGTHSEKGLHVCGVCREWVESIFHIGFDRTRMCPACADKIGQGPASLKAAREGRK